jgi:hypothetical protein
VNSCYRKELLYFPCYISSITRISATRRRKIFPIVVSLKVDFLVFQLVIFPRTIRLNVLQTKNHKDQGSQIRPSWAGFQPRYSANTSFRKSTTQFVNGYSPFCDQRPSNTGDGHPQIYFALTPINKPFPSSHSFSLPTTAYLCPVQGGLSYLLVRGT